MSRESGAPVESAALIPKSGVVARHHKGWLRPTHMIPAEYQSTISQRFRACHPLSAFKA